jgi:hypothetical protein
MSDWRSQYEDATEQDAKCYPWASDHELMDAIRRRRTGDCYVIWYEVAKRPPTAELC